MESSSILNIVNDPIPDDFTPIILSDKNSNIKIEPNHVLTIADRQRISSDFFKIESNEILLFIDGEYKITFNAESENFTYTMNVSKEEALGIIDRNIKKDLDEMLSENDIVLYVGAGLGSIGSRLIGKCKHVHFTESSAFKLSKLNKKCLDIDNTESLWSSYNLSFVTSMEDSLRYTKIEVLGVSCDKINKRLNLEYLNKKSHKVRAASTLLSTFLNEISPTIIIVENWGLINKEIFLKIAKEFDCNRVLDVSGNILYEK